MIVAGLLIIVSAASAAQGQVMSGGSATISAPGGVNIVQDVPTRLLLSMIGVTFAVARQPDGSRLVSLPGFISQERAGAGGMLLVGEAGTQAITGTTLTSQALSLSFGRGAELDRTHGRQDGAPNVTLMLAQYN